MIQCLVIDDEPLATQVLVRYIQDHSRLELAAVSFNALQAFEVLHRQKIDLMFLDIKMPGINGMDFFRSLKDPPPVIFTTAYSGYAVESYELDALDYLVKPITEERFSRSIAKMLKISLQAAPREKKDHLYIKVNEGLVKIIFADIIYLEAMKDYIKVITRSQKVITKMTMKTMDELLPLTDFLRVHRSFIVSLKEVTAKSGNILQVGGKFIPVEKVIGRK
jgi:two-component system LytT family response regulator